MLPEGYGMIALPTDCSVIIIAHYLSEILSPNECLVYETSFTSPKQKHTNKVKCSAESQER